jgi:imidazole glycerol phosphate synthase glutamine amidotransferase subunit
MSAPQNGPGEVVVLCTGVANTAAVVAALRRAGAAPRISRSPEDALRAPRLVLPGVGAFGVAARSLAEAELLDPLRQRLERGAPTLGICLGLHLLTEGSDESPDAAGLGVLPGRVEAFTPAPGLRIPHMGWRGVQPEGDGLVTPGAAYFAHSYRLASAPPGWTATWSHHGQPFVAALQRGPVLGCQFHPELSSSWGRDLIQRWLAAGEGSPPC